MCSSPRGNCSGGANRGTVPGMARPPRADSAPVTWRDGIHIHGTAIWCDALRARDVCFVSCAHAVPSSRHGQLVATAETLAMLGEDRGDSRLAVPYGRPFSLGTHRLELIRSGHSLGSASLLVDVDGHRVLYAGAVNPRGGGLGGAADTRPCDTLILAASYGEPEARFPPVDEVIDAVAGFALDVTASGATAVLLVSSPSKALDVASRLADSIPGCLAGSSSASHRSQLSFFAHRSIYDAATRLRRDFPSLPRLRRLASRPPAGHVLLWPIGRRDAVPANLPAASKVALVSGLATEPGVLDELDVSAGFAWSNQADHDALVEYILTSSAAQIVLTHRHAEALAEELRASRPGVSVLGPPRQMSLF